MFIKKETYQEKIDLIDGYRTERNEALDKLSMLKDQNNRLESRIEYLEHTNARLIDWIQTIIHEVGCYEVNERNPIQIPICKYETSKVYDINSKDLDGYYLAKQEIKVPEITFVKGWMERKEKTNENND